MTLLRAFPHIPLRYLLLIILGGFAALTVPCSYLMTQPLVFRQIDTYVHDEMRTDLAHLQRVLLLLLSSEQLEGTRSMVSALGSDTMHELTVVADATGVIIATTEAGMLGTLWTSHPQALDQGLLARLRTMEPLAVSLSDDGFHLSGYAALCLPRAEASFLPSLPCGFVYTRKNIRTQKATAVQALRAQALQHGLGGLMAALVLWLLLHHTITRRVEQLIAAVQRVTVGDWSARACFTGHGELARVGQAFDSMAQTIAANRQESAGQQQRLTALVQVAQRLTRGLTLPTVLHGIADAAAQVFEGEAAFRLLEDTWLVRIGATPGALAAMVRERVALGESISGQVAATGQPMIISDIASDARVLSEHRQAAQANLVGALMCVPVAIERRVLGTLHIYREQGYLFTSDELTLATSLAHQAAIAIENARLFEALQAQTVSIKQTNSALEAEIHERRQVEASLREGEVRMRAIVETALEGIITIDEHGIVDTYNAAAEQLFGYPPTEVVGQNVQMLMPPPYHEEHDAYIAQYLRTGERKIIGIGREVLGLRKDRTVFPITLAVSEMYVGERRMFTGVITDITVRKQAETALRQANEALEQRVQERTAALAEANEEIKRFAYIVSHDLRAPLVNLKGFAGELRLSHQVLSGVMEQLLPHCSTQQAVVIRRTLTQDIPEALDFIDASVTRMDSLVRAVLQLSRLGRQELFYERLDTQALVQETLQTLGHQLAQRQVQVTVGTLPPVEADRTAMAQIFGNLLTNAVHYLDPERPGVLAISALRHPQATAFQIRDNGRGIAPEDIPRIFEPFRRVGRQDVSGEGMGLAYVRTLVRRHGGEITCQSTLGVGTTFTFTIAHARSGDSPHA
ncbi:MAG: PAS domain S-box protein [Candidatus Tectimicrobiota bacterium]